MTLDLRQAPDTDPTRLYQVRDGLYADDMFIAALTGLDLFTWIDAHPATIADIARHFGFHSRPVDVMTTLFVAMGLLERDGDRLRVTAMAREHLVRSSPWFLGPYFPSVADRPIARDLLDVLRTDQPASFAGRKGEADWHRAMETESVAEEFTAAMDRRGLILAQALAKQIDLRDRRRLLDIGGGSGVYACSLAAHFPQLRATVLEKEPVNRIAARALEQRGFTDRIDVTTADMLTEPLPRGYDVHLFSNVLHDWGEDIVRQLIHASAAALPAGGLLIVHEAFLDAGKTGPPSIAAYSVLLMHVSQGRCYSVAEMDSWLVDAGFDRPRWVPSALERSAAVAQRRATCG